MQPEEAPLPVAVKRAAFDAKLKQLSTVRGGDVSGPITRQRFSRLMRYEPYRTPTRPTQSSTPKCPDAPKRPISRPTPSEAPSSPSLPLPPPPPPHLIHANDPAANNKLVVHLRTVFGSQWPSWTISPALGLGGWDAKVKA